jgi:hypothetical protein
MVKKPIEVEGALFRHNAAILRELLKEQPSLERDKRGAIAFAAQMLEEMAAWVDDLKSKQRE